MQQGVDAIRGTRARNQYVVVRAGGRSRPLQAHRAFRTVSGPSPVWDRISAHQPVAAVRAAARRLGTIGALPVEHERPALAGASRMRWSPPRRALRDHRRRSRSPWRG